MNFFRAQTDPKNMILMDALGQFIVPKRPSSQLIWVAAFGQKQIVFDDSKAGNFIFCRLDSLYDV
ncbi:hypothetical protein D3C78_1732470 [compost metagenome]